MDRDLVEYLQAMEQRITDRLTGAIDHLGQRIGSLELRMGSLELRMDSLEQRIGSLERRMDSLDLRMDSLERRIGSIELRMDSLEERIGSIELRMDSLEQRIGSIELRMDSLEQGIGSIDLRMDSLEHRVVATADLVTSVSESLQREMHAGFEKIHVQLEDMGRRLDRHGSLLQTGARWTSRMATWSERVDKGDTLRDVRISKLADRVFKMEERRPPTNEGA